ncbi:ATP-binding cassette domain-containing protein [Aquihabitans sp. McL0605]|uniref:ATP-binding cassette domain-containing protein n=1 Tax=Aquihabitans sp. McL0605 TaxID=3415671 RepID=UPI003CF34A5E
MSTTPAIEVSGITKRFGEVQALDGIDLVVEPGTVYGLLGPNGAGKTTAVRVLTTIIKPDTGLATVLGLDVTKHPNEVRGLIGLAGQYAAVDEQLTGRENLELVGKLTHQPKRVIASRAEELLERFALQHAADRPLKTFSGGMRRRLDLAASLVHRPPVLFLDEPTTGLDPRSRNDLWDLIRELVADGTTLLLTTQYLEEADVLADRIAVIDRGQVIADGTASELKSQMGATVLEMSFATHADATAALATVTSVVHGAEVEGPMVHAPVEDGARTAMEVLRALDAAGLEVGGLTVREPSLDDVFLSLTGRRAEEVATDDPEGEAA